MITHFVEVTNDGFNWGKFLLMRFDEKEWQKRSALPEWGGRPLLRTLGWTTDNLWVLDLQTGEGAFFRPGGSAFADLEKHKIWVCPMYSPFLQWLYVQDLSDITKLPEFLDLKDAPGALAGYRRPGPPEAQEKPARKPKGGKKRA